MGVMENNVFKTGLALVLILATIVLFQVDIRYRTFSEDLLMNSEFQNDLAGWDILGRREDISVSGRYVEIRGVQGNHKSGLRQDLQITGRREALLIEVDATTSRLVSTESGALPGLLRVVCTDESGATLARRVIEFLSSVLPKAPMGLTHYRDVMVLPEDVRACVFEIYITRDTKGTIRLAELGSFYVSQRYGWNFFYYALLGIWVIAALWIVARAISSLKQSSWRLSWTIAACLVVAGSVIPRPFQEQATAWAAEGYGLFRETVLGDAAMTPGIADSVLSIDDPTKLGHLVLFAMLAYVTRLGWPNRPLLSLIVYLSVFAASVEAVQFFALERHPRLADWLMDMIGVAIGLIGTALSRLIMRFSATEARLH